MSEHASQCALFRWANLSQGKYPELRWMYAVPNGGHRDIRTATKLKEEGVKRGIFDIVLPVPRGGYSSLYIEMKHGPNKLTDEQMRFMEFITQEHGKAVVCWDWEAARDEIEKYLRMDRF